MDTDQDKVENPEQVAESPQQVEGEEEFDQEQIKQKKTEDRDRLAARAKNSKYPSHLVSKSILIVLWLISNNCFDVHR